MTRRTKLLIGALACLCFALGALAGKFYPEFKRYVGLTFIAGHDAESFRWPDGFKVVEIDSSVDGAKQKAYFSRASSSTQKPLLVSLHVWSGNYASKDALAAYAKQHDWNYIHPDFGGPNTGPDNCLSDKVLADIDDAIAFGLRMGNVDTQNIFVVGFSGGAYAALGAYARTRYPVKAWLAWAPISDLEAWFWETKARGHTDLSRHILQCTASGDRLDATAARLRSPLFWDLPDTPRSRIELYAGIKDGHSGTVPISHSIAYYNRLAQQYAGQGRVVTPTETISLLTRSLPATSRKIGERSVFFQQDSGFASLTIFDGGHEMLPDYSFERLLELSSRP